MLCRMVHEHLESKRLSLASPSVARAFVLSLLLHLVAFFTLELGYQAHWWNRTLLFSKRQTELDEETLRRLQAQRLKEEQQEPPLVFIEVAPSQAVEEPPKDSQFYSALNSRAANPDTTHDTPVPKIDGKQEHVPQTMDQSRQQPEPLQPAPPPPAPKVAEAKPEPAPLSPPPPKPEPQQPEPAPPPERRPDLGDLALVKPSDKPREETPPDRPREAEIPKPIAPRPRTLEAARRQKGMIAGEKMRQQGGSRRFALEPSFDVRSTPFGAYDAAIIAAIQKRWYDLLDSRDFAANYSGKVVLEFKLNSDGRVTELRVRHNDVTELLGLLCQRAVQDPAPFAPWPADLRRMVGKEFREVRFTFYYN